MPETSTDRGFGLGNDWSSVQEILEEIIPVYERTNRFISLGSDLRLRRKGLELLLVSLKSEYPNILDLGCGTGSMSRLLLENQKSAKTRLLMVDPIRKMMHVAVSRTNQEGLLATFEKLPMKPASFDGAMAGFSLRDARNLLNALREINSLLKRDGKLLIVDLWKPDSRVKSVLISCYWSIIAPIIAFASSGRIGLKFGALAKTYKRLPKNSEMLDLLEKVGFHVSKAEYSMLGGACVTLLTKV